MVIGICKLCDQKRELKESHIWPSLGYRRYASDTANGGRFVDIVEGRMHNRQYKEYWFCGECEARFEEKYAADWLDELAKQPEAPRPYDSRLLTFATSISFRTALYHDAAVPKQWRQFLLGKRRDVRQFTQHAFVLIDKNGLQKRVGGQLCRNDGFVVAQMGPLMIVGLLERKGIPLSEIRLWRASEIRLEGGTITPFEHWLPEENVARRLFRRLYEREVLTVHSAQEMKAAGRLRE